MHIPKDILALMNTIQDSGYKIYLVGGCVRDHLLELVPADYDLATDARPEELVQILTPKYRVFQVGQEFSTLIVRVSDQNVELSTFRRRVEGEIVFSGTIETDLACRDFTINSMAMSLSGEIIDPYGGKSDLKNRELKSIEARSLLKEDPLRALRAVRFSTKYNLKIDGQLEDAIYYISVLKPYVSPERKREELFKMLLDHKPSEAVRALLNYGLFGWFEFGYLIERMEGYDQENPYHDKSLLDHTLTVLDKTPQKIELRVSALFHDVGKPDVRTMDEVAHYYEHEKMSAEHARKALHYLRCSNQLIDDVTRLIRAHMFSPTAIGEKGLKRLLRKVGGFKQLYSLMDLMEADILATAYPERSVCMDGLRKMVMSMEENATAFRKKDLNVSGRDLIDLGITEGPEIGRLMNLLLEAVLDGDIDNERTVMMDYVQEKRRESDLK